MRPLISERGHLIIVSNRGPFTFGPLKSGERSYTRGAGGLVTALTSVSRGRDAVWVASAISDGDIAVARETAGVLDVEDMRVKLVEHNPEAYQLMYNNIANPLLWFIQHSIYNLPYDPKIGDDTRTAWEDGYVAVNRNFAQAVKSVAAQDNRFPIVLLHDYHLYLAPFFIRKLLQRDALISLFVHIPWPQPDYWRVLPKGMREGILSSLLEADIVAFHTARYVRNFLDTVSELLSVEVDFDRRIVHQGGRDVWVRAYPISIDAQEFEELSDDKRVVEQEDFVRSLPGKLLLRVDRADLSKNIVRGFVAYGRMLKRHPEMRGQVTFLAQLQPSRGDIKEYAEYARAIQDIVDEVNAAYGSEDWSPVVLSMQDNFPRAVAAYKNYDAILVNPILDGMNLVAKEAAVVNRKDGVLILSENAGAYEELGEHAVTVNPFDVDEQAEAIYRALNMPEAERRQRAEALKKLVKSNTIEAWIRDQFEDIKAYRGQNSPVDGV